MSIQMIDGIGFGKHHIFMTNIPGYGPVAGNEKKPAPIVDTETTPWSRWGSDNLLPEAMANDLENCGVLQAAIDAKSRIAIGKGLQPFFLDNIGPDGTEELSFCNDAEVNDWLEANDTYDAGYNSIFDELAYGWKLHSFIFNKGGTKISRLIRKDVHSWRLARRDKATQQINAVYSAYDWTTAPSIYEPSKMVKLPLLVQGYEEDQLKEYLISPFYEVAIATRNLRHGRKYYPLPLWYAQREWVKIARSVPGIKNAMFKNQITIKYVVTVSAEYWDRVHPGFASLEAAKQQEIVAKKYDDIEKWLVGNDNAYKSLFTDTYKHPVSGEEVPYIKIEAIDDKVKDGKLLPDSSAANAEIMFSIMINPALIGAGNPGGNAYGDTSGGSNVRESYLTQLMLMETERKTLPRLMMLVARTNGWKKRLESGNRRLVFRYQSGLLTTLDTGKSTKNETV